MYFYFSCRATQFYEPIPDRGADREETVARSEQVSKPTRVVARKLHRVRAPKRGNEYTLQHSAFPELSYFDTELPELAMQHIEVTVSQMNIRTNQQVHARTGPAVTKDVQQTERRPHLSGGHASYEGRKSLLQPTGNASRYKRPFHRSVAQIVLVQRRVPDVRIHDLVREDGDVMPAPDHPDNLRQDEGLGYQRKTVDKECNSHDFTTFRTAVFAALYLRITVLSYK